LLIYKNLRLYFRTFVPWAFMRRMDF